MAFKDRIKELRRVRGRDLVPNPQNWRTHPKKQLDALSAVLEEIGFAGAALAIEMPDGRLQLLDGHARQELLPDDEIPVLVTDLTPEEGRRLLTVYDPLSAMAEANGDMLKELLGDFQTDSPALTDLLHSLDQEYKLDFYDQPAEGQTDADAVPEPPKVPVTKPGDLWLLGAFFECESCHKKYTYEEGKAMIDAGQECPCG